MRRRSVFSAVNCESDRVALNLSFYHAKLLSSDEYELLVFQTHRKAYSGSEAKP